MIQRSSLKDCLDMGISVYVDEASLKTQCISAEGLVEGVKRANGNEIAGLLKDARATIIF